MKDSILYSVKKKVQIDNNDLYILHNSYKTKFINLIKFIFKSSFLKIFSIIFLLSILVVGYSNLKLKIFINFLEIDFKELLKTLTTSAITLVSMNLFVTNLLLTHLKEERDDLERFINRKIPFRFITYFGFTIIIFLLLLNLIYNHIELERNNLLIFISYCFLVFIGLLIYLYDAVFKFIIKSQRQILISRELKREFSLNIYRNKLKREFSETYNKIFLDINFKESSPNLFMIKEELEGNFNITFKSSKVKYFRDLKYKSLTQSLNKLKYDNHFYSTYNIDDKMPTENDMLLLSLKIENDKLKTKKIKSAFVYRSKPMFDLLEDIDILSMTLERMNKNVKNEKIDDLKIDLLDIKEIFNDFYKKFSNG